MKEKIHGENMQIKNCKLNVGVVQIDLIVSINESGTSTKLEYVYSLYRKKVEMFLILDLFFKRTICILIFCL